MVRESSQSALRSCDDASAFTVASPSNRRAAPGAPRAGTPPPSPCSPSPSNCLYLLVDTPASRRRQLDAAEDRDRHGLSPEELWPPRTEILTVRSGSEVAPADGVWLTTGPATLPAGSMMGRKPSHTRFRTASWSDRSTTPGTRTGCVVAVGRGPVQITTIPWPCSRLPPRGDEGASNSAWVEHGPNRRRRTMSPPSPRQRSGRQGQASRRSVCREVRFGCPGRRKIPLSGVVRVIRRPLIETDIRAIIRI